MHYSIVLAACDQHHSIIQVPFPISVSNWGNLTSFLFRNKRIAFIKLVPRFTLSISQENKTDQSVGHYVYVTKIKCICLARACARTHAHARTHTHVRTIRVMMKDKIFIVRRELHSRTPEHSSLLGWDPVLLGRRLLKFWWNSLSQIHGSSSPKPRICGPSKCQEIFSQHSAIPYTTWTLRIPEALRA